MLFAVFLSFAATSCNGLGTSAPSDGDAPYLVVLGIAQDGGVPQTGDTQHPGWHDPRRRRRVVCLGLVDPVSEQRWMFEATPDFPEQLQVLDDLAPRREDDPQRPILDGIFLTHAHVGHYTGLAFLGHEVLGARDVAVHALPRMAAFLRTNGPWSQLVEYQNVRLNELVAGEPLRLNERLSVTALEVPHRQEFSEVAGFRIDGPRRSVFFLPDIDSWEAWDAEGTRIEDVLATVDVALLDATFFANGELPGRDMTGFPHPFVRTSMERFADLPPEHKAKVRFLHLNHSNPILWDGPERRLVEASGFRVEDEGTRHPL